jgi:glycosyltransferase involved in cell wall biosynthesis
MPLYNVEQFVGPAIDSILCQTFTDFEFLIINDGSADGSAEIARSYRDPRITVWDQVNSGPGAAMNRGLAYALEKRMPYIARMDADDISLPERLEKQYNLIQRKQQVAACSANCFYIDSKTGETIGTSTISGSSWLIRWEVFQGLRGLIQGTCLFRTEALSQIGGYRLAFKRAEETDLFLRLAERYELINHLDFLYKIRIHTNSLSLGNVHQNIMYQFYGLDCSERRRQGRPERSFEAFTKMPGLITRFEIWREENVLKIWRDNLGRKAPLSIFFASILDPRRALVRIIRMLDSWNYKARSR